MTDILALASTDISIRLLVRYVTHLTELSPRHSA